MSPRTRECTPSRPAARRPHGAAVVEVRHDRVTAVFDRAQPLAIGDWHAAARGRVQQDALERRAQDGDTRPRSAEHDPPDGAAALVAEGELARWRARRRDLIRKPEGFEDAHAVGRDLEPAADGGRFRVGFEDLGLDPAALEEQRYRGPRDAAADNDGA